MDSMVDRGPKAFIVDEPDNRNIRFGGKFINISDLSRSLGIDITHTSRVLRGTREASVKVAISLASALGMSMDDFLSAIDDRKNEIDAEDNAHRSSLEKALKNEVKRKKRAGTDGRVFVPHVALGRVK